MALVDIPRGGHLALTTDGKILVGGMAGNVTLARLNLDGTADTTFGTDGRVILGGFQGYSGLTELAVQSDNKVLVAVNSDSGTTLIRLHPDGTPDPTFDNGGRLVTPWASDVTLQADGKIVLAGNYVPGACGISPDRSQTVQRRRYTRRQLRQGRAGNPLAG